MNVPFSTTNPFFRKGDSPLSEPDERPSVKPVREWSVAEVQEWIRETPFSAFISKFAYTNGKTLKSLPLETLIIMGIPPEAACPLKVMIDELDVEVEVIRTGVARKEFTPVQEFEPVPEDVKQEVHVPALATQELSIDDYPGNYNFLPHKKTEISDFSWPPPSLSDASNYEIKDTNNSEVKDADDTIPDIESFLPPDFGNLISLSGTENLQDLSWPPPSFYDNDSFTAAGIL
jgi:hypothetical protein